VDGAVENELLLNSVEAVQNQVLPQIRRAPPRKGRRIDFKQFTKASCCYLDQGRLTAGSKFN
jgi:hypothetical protein